MADLGYVRELNEGVPRIYSAMLELTLAKPEYRDENSTVTLTLRNRVSEHKETIFSEVLDRIEEHWKTFNSSQRGLICLLFETQEATIDQMADKIGVSKQAIRYNLKSLEQLRIVERKSDKIRDPKALYHFRNG